MRYPQKNSDYRTEANLVTFGFMTIFVGLGIAGYGIEKGFDRSLATGLVVTFSALAIMGVGIFMVLLGWVRSL